MKSFFILALLILFTPLYSHAVSASFVLPKEPVRVGDEFVVEVFLDTEQQTINALEGAFSFLGGVSLKEVRYAGSVVSLWITNPRERTPGVIDFAGIVPGGYQATPEKVGRGNLFTLVFKANEKGSAAITLGADSKSYLNDGDGTAVSLQGKSSRFTIETAQGSTPQVSGIAADQVPPEDFTPYIVSGEPYGVEGDVLIFETTDRDSGMQKYLLAKSYIGFLPKSMLTWTEAKSPYSITSSDSYAYIYVDAVDVSGNSRIKVLSPRGVSLPIALLVIVSVGAILVLIFRHRRAVRSI